MNQPLRWGLMSTARINRAVIPPLQASRRNRLEAVASRDLAKAQAYAREHGIPRAYGSYEEMLADPKIDVVYISLPNSLHAKWTIKAAQAGKHVLCEKPLAISLEEVDAVTAAARENHVVVAEAFMYRHIPQTLKVQELVASGALGQVWLVRGAFSFKLSRTADVRLEAALLGGSLWDVGCYPVSYARTVYQSEPEQVYGWQEIGSSGVDMCFAGQMTFPGQAAAQIDSGFKTAGRTFIEIVGDEGWVSIPKPFNPREDTHITLVRGDREEQIRFPRIDLYSFEVEDMAAAILDGKPPRISLADSRGNVATLLALYESANRAAPVRLK